MDEVVFNEAAVVDATTLTGSYVVKLSGLVDAREVEVQNNADQDVSVSFNGSAQHYLLRANNSKLFNVGNRQYQFSGNVYIKHAGVLPSDGTVDISSHGL